MPIIRNTNLFEGLITAVKAAFADILVPEILADDQDAPADPPAYLWRTLLDCHQQCHLHQDFICKMMRLTGLFQSAGPFSTPDYLPPFR